MPPSPPPAPPAIPSPPAPPPNHVVLFCDELQQEITHVCEWFLEAWSASDGMPGSCSQDCLKLLESFADCAHEKHFNNYTTMVTQCHILNLPYSPPPMKLPAKPPSPPALPFPPSTPCSLPWNLRERLEPPEGTGWRGSTLGVDKLELGGTFSDMQDPEEYEWKYGVPLHIFRVFKGRGNAKLNDLQVTWAKTHGGIIFYSVYKTYDDWADVGNPKYDWVIDQYIEQFNKVYPAKMWIW